MIAEDNNLYYVSFKTAKLLRKCGYNEDCYMAYDCDESYVCNEKYNESPPILEHMYNLYDDAPFKNSDIDIPAAPLIFDVLNWLDRKNIIVTTQFLFEDIKYWTYIISIIRNDKIIEIECGYLKNVEKNTFENRYLALDYGIQVVLDKYIEDYGNIK